MYIYIRMYMLECECFSAVNVCVCLRDILLCKGGWLRSTSFEFIVKKDMYPPFGLRGGKKWLEQHTTGFFLFWKGAKSSRGVSHNIQSVAVRRAGRTCSWKRALETFLNFRNYRRVWSLNDRYKFYFFGFQLCSMFIVDDLLNSVGFLALGEVTGRKNSRPKVKGNNNRENKIRWNLFFVWTGGRIPTSRFFWFDVIVKQLPLIFYSACFSVDKRLTAGPVIPLL